MHMMTQKWHSLPLCCPMMTHWETQFWIILLGIGHKFKFPQNILIDWRLQALKPEDSFFEWTSINSNYSLTGYEMVLNRNSLKYIVNYYLPSGLFVLVSWVSFLIPPEIVPGRMTLLVTIFLVLINIFNNVTSNSPNVEGLTAISSNFIQALSKISYWSCFYQLGL